MLVRIISRLSIAVLIFSFFTSCMIENLQISSASDNEIVLSIPGTEDVEVRSTATSAECYIQNAAVLIVSGGTVTGAEYVTSITDNGSRTPSLKLSSLTPSSGETVHVVCNFDPAVTASAVSALAGQDFTEAQGVIYGKAAYSTTDGSTTAELETPLLMYGSTTWTSGGSGTISMTFQVAKISVEIEEGSAAANSDLSVVSFFSLASAPNTYWGGSNQTSDGNHRMSANVGDHIYLYESDRPNSWQYTTFSSVILQVTNPASVVDDGITVAGETAYICLTYDDMKNDGSVNAYKTFQRGYHYTFTIKDIYTRGYSTPEEALNNPGNVEYEVEEKDNWSTGTEYNGQYALRTQIDTTYVFYNTTTPDTLITIGLSLPEGADKSMSATVKLLKLNNGSLQTVDGTVVTEPQLSLSETSSGTESGNVLTIPASELVSDDGCVIYFTASTSGVGALEGYYLHIQYGNLEKYITVGSARLALSFDDETTSTAFTYESQETNISVLAEVYWPGSSDPDNQAYTISYINSDGTNSLPTWMRIDWDSGKIEIDENTGVITTFDDLKNSKDSAYDLSHYLYDNTSWATGQRNTANCYVVDASGYYKLPLVYGNGIKNDAVNASAYADEGADGIGGGRYQKFIDHKGKEITTPYIHKQLEDNSGEELNTTDFKAVVVWQDVENLIDQSSLDLEYVEAEDMWYLHFKVNDNIPSEGNAVVGVKYTDNTNIDDGVENEYIWSWHIWVTGYDIYDDLFEVTSWTENTYNLSNRYLGAVASISSNPRSVRIVITTGLKSVSIYVYQAGFYEAGDNTYYQAGRKDPIPGMYLDDNGERRNKPTYGEDTWDTPEGEATAFSNSKNTYSYGPSWYRGGIAWPYKMNISEYSTGNNYPYNYWNSAQTNSTLTSTYFSYTQVVKTIYDPSPPGLSLPPNDVFSAFFTSQNYNTANSSSGGGYAYLNSQQRYYEDIIAYPIVIHGNEDDIYYLQVVPYRSGADDGAMFTVTTFSVHTATPSVGQYTPYANFAVHNGDKIDDYLYASVSSARSRINARAVLCIKEK